MNKQFTLVEVAGEHYIPVTALLRIAKKAIKEAKKIAPLHNISLNEIGVDLNKFHTLEIAPDGDVHVRLRYTYYVKKE